MGTALEEQHTGGTHALRRRNMGEVFVGGLVHFEWRNEQDDQGKPKPKYGADGQPVMKNGEQQFKKEIVIHLMTKESTMVAGLGDEEGVPEAGRMIRFIASGGGAAQWIEAVNTYKKQGGGVLETGLLVAINSTYGEQYRTVPGQRPQMVGRIDTQEELDEYRQKRASNPGFNDTMGLRGDLGVKGAEAEDEKALAEACTAFHAEHFTNRPEATPLEQPAAAPTSGAPASPGMDGFFSAGG